MALQRIGVYHHHHHHTACSVLGLVPCSGPTNSPQVFRGITLGFVSHTVDISQLSVAVCLSVSVRSPNTLYPFVAVILNFLHHSVNFKYRYNIVLHIVLEQFAYQTVSCLCCISGCLCDF